jgi:hypothetical protein
MARNSVKTHIYRYLTNDAGERIMNKNYESASASANGSKVFYYCASTSVELSRMLFYIQDGVTGADMAPGEYGNLGSALSAGYTLHVWNSANGSSELDITDTIPVKTNGDLSALCYDVTLMNWATTGSQVVTARFTFAKTGKPLFLEPKNVFRVGFSDDLSGLLDHRMQVQGYQIKGI